MCLHLCVIPLVMCPGLWVNDIIGTCTMVSLPPMCTQAFFWMLWKIPPQYVTMDEASPYPKECPKTDLNDLGGADDPQLYDSVGADIARPSVSEASAIKGGLVSPIGA